LSFADLVRTWPIIPAVRKPEDLDASIASPSQIVYLLCGTILTIEDLVGALHNAGKIPIVNLDLQVGLAKDATAVAFLERCGAAGIISTHPETLRSARSRNMMAVQRSFILDSQALTNSLRALNRFMPDAVELLPAPAASRVVPAFANAHPNLTLIAGGLITSLHEIDQLINDGVHAVSVSLPTLWVA